MNDEPGPCQLEVAISLQDAAWGEELEDLEEMAQRSIETALRCLGDAAPEYALQGAVEVSLLFADDAAVAELNEAYRGRQGPTNVLSFPNMEQTGAPVGQPRLLGDVVLARQTVLREATAQGKSPAAHTTHLLVHGLLHLLGYDHEGESEAAEMEALETAILAELGLPDPYAEPASGSGGAAPDAVGELAEGR